MPDTSEPQPARESNGRWVAGGTSPFPKGRPPGPSKQQKLLKRMLDEANEVLDAVLAKAKEGDHASAGLVLGRILPVLRAQSQTGTFDFDTSLPVARQVEQVLLAISTGQIAPDLGQQIISAIGTLSTVRATEELAERLAILEAKAIN